VDVRHFELQDLLAAALIALEARDHAAAETALKNAVAWVEHDWLATPSEIRLTAGSPTTPADDDEEED